MPDHDVVVVGGGHNGLVAAAYLARHGMSVLVVEARESTGGCAATVDALGVRVNICNCDHVLVRGTPIVDELDLAAHGLRYLDLEPHIAAVPWDGSRPWFAFHDLGGTLESLAASHPDQVEGYRRWMEDAEPVARLMLDVTNDAPTPGNVLRHVRDRGGRGVATLLAWQRMSAKEVLSRYLSSEAVMSPMLATAPTVWGLAPDTPRTGLAAVSFAMRHLVAPGRPAGGSGAFPQAVRAALEEAGGSVRCGAAVDRILVERGRVRGVRIAGGEDVSADVVVAAVDPYRVFVDWLDLSVPEQRRWRRRTSDTGYESKLDAVLSEPPRLRGVDQDFLRRHNVADPLVPTVMIAPPLEEMAHNHALLGAGRVGRRPVLYVNVPTVLDPELRRDGHHVLSLEVLFTPYDLVGGWKESSEPERWLQLAGSVMDPGFLDSVLRWRLMGPEQYERDFGLRNGYASSFAASPLAAVIGRPPELTRYRTSVGGLYVTGAATFPGAGVWGAAGRNAAGVVIRDRG
jgi:phytoene dehydrogenase-like protein